MFLVKTKLKKSKISGFGVFADEDIPIGTKVISLENELSFSTDAIDNMQDVPRSYILHYGYKEHNRYFLPMDNERFLNHSNKPNLGFVGDYTGEIALTNINKGDELTVNYKTFDESFPGREIYD